ncbi:MAG TPA: DUF3826 domain-containing protein [Pseudomonadales bacterium]|nr:DUF3826 domain-containing protein [Pseudomonadales bacterium]
MKSIIKVLLLAAILTAGLSSGKAQTNSPTTVEEKQQASLNKHIKPILDALNLNDPAKETKVQNVLSEFFIAHTAWHQTNDATLKDLWNNFNHARAKQDKAGADKALTQIDAIYATFKPEHDKLISGLAAVLSPQQIATVEDVLTVNKVKVTYIVYLEIFPTLTAEQKAVVLKDLEAARDQATDAGSMVEKSAFFKIYKIEIEENYLTAQGYDPKQARKDFAAKQKAATAAQ